MALYQTVTSPSVDSHQTHREGHPEAVTVHPWTVSAFKIENLFEAAYTATVNAIADYAGGNPVMPKDYYTFNPTGEIYDRYFYRDPFSLNSFLISADVRNTSSPGVPILPMRVRMRISRLNLGEEKWNYAVDYENNGGNLASVLPKICTIWAYSPHTTELYTNLFAAIENRGYQVKDCAQAFTYGDFLYVDLMVLLADAKSRNAGKTAFCEIVKHDRVNYLLLGDGYVDNRWRLGFFTSGATTSSGGGDGGGGGGGCDVGGWGIALLCPAFLLRFTPVFKKR